MLKKKLVETHLKDTDFKNNLYKLCVPYLEVKDIKSDFQKVTELVKSLVELTNSIYESYIKTYTNYENHKKNTDNVANSYLIGFTILGGSFITSFSLLNFTITNLNLTKKQSNLLVNEFISNIELQLYNILLILELKVD